MLELKESRYNYRLHYDDQVLFFNGMTRQFIPVPLFLQEIVESFLANPNKTSQESPRFLDKLKSTGLLIDKSIDEIEVIRERHQQARNAASYELILTLDEPFVHQNRSEISLAENRSAMSEQVRQSIKRHLDRYVVQHHLQQLQLEWLGKGVHQHLQHEIKEISEYAVNVCQANKVDFQIGITTHYLSFKEQDVALLKKLPVRSIRLLLDLSNQGKQHVAKEEVVVTFLTHLKQLVTSLPDVLFILLIQSDIQSFDFQSFIQSMNEQFSEQERVNISVFVHDELSASRQNGASLREDMLRRLYQSGYNQQWEDLLPMLCSGEKKHAYTMYGEGSVGKCAVSFNQTAPGYVTTHGNVFWDETTTRMDSDIPFFENMRCLSCKHLPLCMGQCIPIQRIQGENKVVASSDCLLPPWGISPESAIRNYCSSMMEHYVDDDKSEL